MLSPELLDRYRRMTPAERLRETIELMEFAESALAALPPEERERRLRIVAQQHRESSEAIVRGLVSA